MKLSISEAARRAGVNRTTLHRQIEKGTISKEIGEDGKPVIDLAELARVYPSAVSPQRAQQGVQHQSEQVGTDALLRENSLLRETVDDLRKERDRLLGVVEQQTRVLTDQRPGSGFWGRIFGR